VQTRSFFAADWGLVHKVLHRFVFRLKKSLASCVSSSLLDQLRFVSRKMKFVLVLLVACVALVAASAISTHRGSPNHAGFQVHSYKVDPTPIPVRGEGHVVINGTALDPILEGRGHVTVTRGGQVILHRVMDLCKELVHHYPCPLKGDVEIRVPLFLPQDNATAGEYEAMFELWVHEAHGDSLAVRMHLKFEVAAPSENCGACGSSA
jgi:hypothetical protein